MRPRLRSTGSSSNVPEFCSILNPFVHFSTGTAWTARYFAYTQIIKLIDSIVIQARNKHFWHFFVVLWTQQRQKKSSEVCLVCLCGWWKREKQTTINLSCKFTLNKWNKCLWKQHCCTKKPLCRLPQSHGFLWIIAGSSSHSRHICLIRTELGPTFWCVTTALQSWTWHHHRIYAQPLWLVCPWNRKENIWKHQAHVILNG